MHILVAAHDFYPDPDSGGTGRYVYETARRIIERGHRVSVITRRRGDVPSRETVAGIDVYRYDFSIAGGSARSILAQLPDAWKAVNEMIDVLARLGQPDLVSFQGLITPLLVDRCVPDETPRVTTFHSPWPTEYAIRTRGATDTPSMRRWLNIVNRWAVERHMLSQSDHVITLSSYMLGQLRRVHHTNLDATVIPAGVDTERFTPHAGSDEPQDTNGVVFLTVRRLMRRMGYVQLLTAFSAVLADYPDARLYLGGAGPIREELERRAAQLDIAHRTTFLGYIPDETLPSVYATADVFVLPTQELEGFGLATLEALASGTPVVATPIGGTVEVLSGLRYRLPVDPLVNSPRAHSLADGMRTWAQLDDYDRQRAGECCRQYVRDQYDWEQTVSGILTEYERHR